MKKLKPCPFCGSKKLKKLSNLMPSGCSVFWVGCETVNCAGSGPQDSSMKDAVEAWNKRDKK